MSTPLRTDAANGGDRRKPVLFAGLAVAMSVGVAVALLVGAHGSPAPSAQGGTIQPGLVQVTEVEWNFAGYPCDGEPTFLEGPGAEVAAGSSLNLTHRVVNDASLGTCTFQEPSVPAGFTVLDSDLPITVDGEANATIQLEIATPASGWNASLTVTVEVVTAL